MTRVRRSRDRGRLDDMPLHLHHIVIDAHDLRALANFWAEALGWNVLSVRDREVVVGASIDAPVGLCFMPAGAAQKVVKNRIHLDLTTTVDDRDAEIERLLDIGHAGSTSVRRARSPGMCWPIRKGTSSASSALRPRWSTDTWVPWCARSRVPCRVLRGRFVDGHAPTTRRNGADGRSVISRSKHI